MPVADVLLIDWRNDPRLPRDGYYERRADAISAAIIHNTGGDEDVTADNDYHRHQAVWVAGDPSVHAMHIAYHLWLPTDPGAFLALHGIQVDQIPAAVVVWCNEIWERSWHATNANDVAVGIATQGDGQATPFSEAQQIGIKWALDTFLPSQGAIIPRERVFGHGECDKVYSGGVAWGNNTVCPGVMRLPWVKALRDS